MPRHRLFLSDSFQDSWHGVLRPWLAQYATEAWKQALYTVVLTPTRGHGNALRQKWLESGHGLLGLRFWTPSDARAFLAQRFPQQQLPATRENMHLLLSAAAGERMRQKLAEDPAARPGSLLSVSTDSSVLARALDDLGAAGWSWKDQGPTWTRPLLELYSEQLEACGLSPLQHHDRQLFEAARREVSEHGPILGPVLVHGFGPEYWPKYQTLRSVAVASAGATIVLPYPTRHAEDAAQTWISTWELWTGTERDFVEQSDDIEGGAESGEGKPAFIHYARGLAEWLEVNTPHSSSSATGTPGRRSNSSSRNQGRIRFLLGKGVAEEARAAALQAVEFLESAGEVAEAQSADSDSQNLRIGIVVPGLGAMAREVSALLASWQVPHFDSVGHNVPGQFSAPAWEAWLDLQLRPCRRTLLRLIRVWPRQDLWPRQEPVAVVEAEEAELFPDEETGDRVSVIQPEPMRPLGLGQVEDVISAALADIFIDDVRLIRESLKSSKRGRDVAVGNMLDSVVLLASEGTFDEYLNQLREALMALGWLAELAVIDRQSVFLKGRMSLRLQRNVFLHWLREVTEGVGKTRDAMGRHFYARVHLVTYEEALGQPWSHLILTSLIDGIWPPPNDESAFLSEEDIKQLNKRVRDWNRATLGTVAAGRGEFTPTLGRAWCLAPEERRQLAEARLLQLVASPTRGLALTTRLGEESEPARELNANAFFMQIYFADHGEWLNEEISRRLEHETEALLLQAPSVLESQLPAPQNDADPVSSVRATPPGQTRVARLARTGESELPRFTEYEFALRTRPEEPKGRSQRQGPPRIVRPVSLPCREWELALKAPAIVWMKRLLGVGPDRAEDDDITARSTGQWVHQWLARAPLAAGRGHGRTPARPMPNANGWRRTIRQSANTSRSSVQALAARHGRPLPPLWVPVWSHAAYLAFALSEVVSDCGFSELAAEVALKPPGSARGGFVPYRTASGAELLLEGRMDVLLHEPDAVSTVTVAPTEPEPSPMADFDDETSPFLDDSDAESFAPAAPEQPVMEAIVPTAPAIDDLFSRSAQATARRPGLDFPNGRWMILDYKTGKSTKPISVPQLTKGTGLQVALYALALRQMGARAVSFAYACPGIPLNSGGNGAPVSVLSLAELQPLLDNLAQMQNNGRFGWHGELRPEFGHRMPYPLATLPVPEDLLERKWIAEHNALGGAL
ncbi:MAG: PD-(D/E)XK nuclease family protein [Candidatus Methylacidiphilales bacterium]